MADPEEEENESSQEEGSDEELKEEDNEGKEAEEEDEIEEEEEVKPVKKRRCQRKKKVQQICFDDEDGDKEEEEEEEGLIFHEDEEDEEEGEEEVEKSDDVSLGPSVLSAISFVWENEVYEFEELCDPGNIDTIYTKIRRQSELVDEIGMYRYLNVCQALMVTPTISIIRALNTKEIDLSYRNINGHSIRAVCAALEVNSDVEKLIMKYNKLKLEDCHYIGTVLYYNDTISHLDFTGCRVGPSGLEELIAYLSQNESVVYLNLSKNNILDQGMKFLGYVLTQNNTIQTLDLSYNKLGDEAAEALGLAFKFNTSITDLNLRYNNLFDPTAMKGFFRSLTANNTIQSLDLSWNGLSGVDMGSLVGILLKKSESIKHLDLSDNRFEGMAVIEIKKGLSRSKTMQTLKLGKNPMSPEDLEVLLAGTKGCTSLVQLDLEDLWVKKTFVKALNKIQADREIEVKFAGIYGNYEVFGPDYPKVILQRAQFEAMKPKKPKKRKDFGHLIWTLGDEPLTQDEFMTRVNKFKAKISKELFPELIKQFLIPKAQLVDVVAMRQKYLSIFPDSTPPPPPKVKAKKGQPPLEEPKTEIKHEENPSGHPTKAPDGHAKESFKDLTVLNEDLGEEEEEDEEEEEKLDLEDAEENEGNILE